MKSKIVEPKEAARRMVRSIVENVRRATDEKVLAQTEHAENMELYNVSFRE